MTHSINLFIYSGNIWFCFLFVIWYLGYKNEIPPKKIIEGFIRIYNHIFYSLLSKNICVNFKPKNPTSPAYSSWIYVYMLLNSNFNKFIIANLTFNCLYSCFTNTYIHTYIWISFQTFLYIKQEYQKPSVLNSIVTFYIHSIPPRTSKLATTKTK